MGTGAIPALEGTTAKQKAEAINFEAFRLKQPNFAGRPLVSTQWGGDPPDVLCLDTEGRRIGVELVQWVNQAQMAASKARYKLEDSYRLAIRSSEVEPPTNIGSIILYAKERVLLAPQDATAFRKELYDFVLQIDTNWLNNPDRSDPQRYTITDFATYPSLNRHIQALDVYTRGPRFNPRLGVDWLTFWPRRGAYIPNWMIDALVNNIKRKVAKYAKPRNEEKLQQQQLAEFYLLAYYDEAVLHNTPYHWPGFGFQEIAAIVGRELATNPHPFDRVFLYSPLEKAPVIQAWTHGD